MHRALKILDVVNTIVRYLDPQNAQDAKGLHSLATSCKALTGPALDVLWASMSDINPLFKVFLGFQPGTKDEPASLKADITHEELEVFELYASRIRVYLAGYGPTIPDDVYEEVLNKCQRAHLLPRLQSLTWLNADNVSVKHFVSPTLRAFNFVGNQAAPNLSAVLDKFPGHAVSLTAIELRGALAASDLQHIWSLQRVEKLALNNTTWGRESRVILPSAILDLPSRDYLRQLRLQGNITLDTRSTLQGPPRMFPKLTSLSLQIRSTTSMESMLLILHKLRAPQLECLLLAFSNKNPSTTVWPPQPAQHDAEEAVHWRSFFQYLCDHTSTSLRSLHVVANMSDAAIREVPSTFLWANIGLTALDLLAISNLTLTSFVVQIPVFHLTHDHIMTIIGLWPTLQELKLSTGVEPTLEYPTLMEIAKKLPDLHTLEIPILGRSVPDPFPLLNHGLQTLFLTGFNLGDACGTASTLDRLFPNLCRSTSVPWEKTDRDATASDRQGWRLVDTMLYLVRKTRADDTQRREQREQQAQSTVPQ